jgi:hypothetical protein
MRRRDLRTRQEKEKDRCTGNNIERGAYHRYLPRQQTTDAV